MPETDLELLIGAARAAGEIALRFSGPTARRWDKPGDAGPVTEADLAVNDLLVDRLRGARPGYGWLSEESEDDTSRTECEHVFIVDPIDGTRSFIEGARTWAHALAIARQGVVQAAVVYLPQRDMLYSANTGGGAYLNGRPIRTAERSALAGASVLAAKPTLAPGHWRGAVPDISRAHRPSLAYRTCLVAEGRFDAMLTFRPTWEWDVAAGDLILREAGAATSDRQGRPLRFNNRAPRLDGAIAANPHLHRQIIAAMAPGKGE